MHLFPQDSLSVRITYYFIVELVMIETNVRSILCNDEKVTTRRFLKKWLVSKIHKIIVSQFLNRRSVRLCSSIYDKLERNVFCFFFVFPEMAMAVLFLLPLLPFSHPKQCKRITAFIAQFPLTHKIIRAKFSIPQPVENTDYSESWNGKRIFPLRLYYWRAYFVALFLKAWMRFQWM